MQGSSNEHLDKHDPSDFLLIEQIFLI